MSDDQDPYEVGYGKPPKSTRFKKGRSGNRKGRPKGARGLKTDLKEELGAHVKVTENGKVAKYTKQQVVVKRLVEKAAKGDMRTISKLIDLNIAIFGFVGEVAVSRAALSQGDQDIINQALNRMAAEAAEKESGDNDE